MGWYIVVLVVGFIGGVILTARAFTGKWFAYRKEVKP